jgi:4-diphosphocytidyl-2-C-methyl-D-erythritol kinase
MTLRTRAPAKINLSLEILGKRPDGYHDLRTVMASVSLYDELTITLTPCEAGAENYTACADGVDGDNLAAEAARLFSVAGWSVHVDIEKRIPIGAGLGGGSSDAAAVLRVLDGWAAETDGRRPLLQKIALQLGSDVPYCLHGGVCLAGGRGEMLTPLPPLPPCRILLCTPPVRVSTAEMFAKFDPAKHKSFEDIIFLPEVGQIKQVLLECGASQAAMSGSGPTVFGIFDDESQTKTAFEKLYPTFPTTFITQPV